MGSRTARPFQTTNLVVFAPENVPNASKDNKYIASGDALIVDPGCLSEFHGEVILLYNMPTFALSNMSFQHLQSLFHAHVMHFISFHFILDHTVMTI